MRISPLLALVCLLPLSNFQAVVSVPPEAGGRGIQAALDGLPPGGEVVLGPGKYIIHEAINLRKDGQSLRGAGDATVLYLADQANCPVVLLGSLTASAKNPTKHVRVADLSIDGNRKNQAREVWKILPSGDGLYNNGVDVWGTDGAVVENVACGHCRSGGLVTTGGTRHLTVRDYTAFDSQFDGLACYFTEDSYFSHLNLHDNLSAGISLDLNFNHNTIDNAALDGDDLGIFMRQSCDNVFKDVKIEKSRHHGIFMAESGVRTSKGWKLAPDSRCTGNLFSSLFISHCAGKAFLVNDDGCTNNTIASGRFLDNAQGGLFQAAANLVKSLIPDVDVSGKRPAKVIPVVHRMPEATAVAAQAASKAL